MIAVVVINYRQTAATLACLESLYANAGHPFHLVVVDNAADAQSSADLSDFVQGRSGDGLSIRLLSSPENRGFAGGCNQALELILDDPHYDAVALVNNDTVVGTDWLKRMADRLDPSHKIGMVAGCMVEFDRPDVIDSLGITLYRSGIASNRKDPADPLLGPCGGGALYSLALLRDARTLCGTVFDPDFFCYAEDTDLALRARALGYDCAFAEDAVLRHHGGLATGGGYNEFIAYHGLRNTIFAIIKSLPAEFLSRHFGWILLMQLAVIARYLIKGKPALVWRIYRDVLRGMPRVLRQRRRILASVGRSGNDWRLWICPRFYDRNYLIQSLRTLHRRDIHPLP